MNAFKHFILVFFILHTYDLYSQVSKQDSALSQRIEIIEKTQESTKLLYEAKTEQLKLDYEKFKNDLQDQTSFNKVLGLIFGSVTIVGLIIGWFSVYNKAKSYADDKVKNTIDNLLLIEKGKIINIVNSHDEEYQLKQNSNILVVSSKVQELEFEDFFNKIGFKNVEYNVSEARISDTLKYDMVFFNNEDEYFDDDKISKYYEKDSNQVYFVLGPKKIEMKKRMNCSNSKISMYNNLMSTLKYQKLISS